MKPYGDVIFVEPAQEPDEADSPLVIVDGKRSSVPRMAGTTRRWGRVIAAGPGRKLKRGGRAPMAVQPGDLVLFGYHVGMGVQPSKQDPELLVMRETDVLLVADR